MQRDLNYLHSLCDCHNEIYSTARELQEELDPEQPGYQKLFNDLQYIIDVSSLAGEMGQSMEDRLKEYYEAIISIGFERRKEEC